MSHFPAVVTLKKLSPILQPLLSKCKPMYFVGSVHHVTELEVIISLFHIGFKARRTLWDLALEQEVWTRLACTMQSFLIQPSW